MPSREQFRGCLLGHAVGDALGAPYEGLPADMIFHDFGPPEVLVRNPSGETLYYSDDTQMMIGVAETLLRHGCIVEGTLREAFLTNYDPARGYGPGTRRILGAWAEGEDGRELARTLFPGGSLGNGAAMRVAPVGLLFADDLDRVMEEARLSALPTHVHPVGIEGSQVFALAVALACGPAPWDRKAFYRELRARARTEEFRWALRTAARLRPADSVAVLGNSLEAHRSVATAIACFTAAPDDYEQAIGRALGLGNDTDTLAAMAGALSGAHLGIGAVPPRLVAQLEVQTKGRPYLMRLADGLFERYVRGDNDQDP